ncbi:MAG: Rieske 2Fe-2S domain-containing protein [Candidatus Baltobacteraceae bacterium]|jgi:nitrite reductase/ring-hydroxylating ferredoxin subunit
MPTFVTVASVEEIPPGKARSFVVGDYEVALFNVAGAFYAIENSCPHQGGPLADGWFDGKCVVCPWHAWCFDVTTGQMTPALFATVPTFDVQVEGSTIAIASEPRS